MMALRKVKALILVFTALVLVAGIFSILSTSDAQASRTPCCWVMVCPVHGPGPCWEECRPCPPLPPPPP